MNRQGFTLVEVILTLAIVAAVIAVAVSFLMFGSNFLSRTETKAADKTVAEQSADYIKERLLYASSVTVVRAAAPPAAANGGDVLFIGRDTDGDGRPDELSDTGRLYYMRADDAAGGAMDVLASAYKGNELALSYAAEVAEATDGAIEKRVFTLTATAIRDGGRAYASTKTFRLYDVTAKGDPTEDVSATTWDGDDPARNETFYLLIGTQGYAQAGLVLHLDAIDNTTAGGEPHHDAAKKDVWSDLSGNGNDVKLVFTPDGNDRIRSRAVYFDGDGDYGVTVQNLDLTGTGQVTVEVCFRPANTASGMLAEHSANWNSNSSAFGVNINSDGNSTLAGTAHTVGGFQASANTNNSSAWNYVYTPDTSKFTTHSNTFSRVADPTGRLTFVDGAGPVAYTTKYKKTTETTNGNPTAFGNYQLFIASRAGTGSWFKGEIASIRVYNRKLTEGEIAQNAAEDRLRFG